MQVTDTSKLGTMGFLPMHLLFDEPSETVVEFWQRVVDRLYLRIDIMLH